MPSHRGRPALDRGFNTTIRLNDPALEIVDQGAALLADYQSSMVSRSAWIRYLLDQTLTRRHADALVTPQDLHKILALVAEYPTNSKITVKLEDHHRIKLRQFECYAQSLDWTVDFFRNEAILLLIMKHGVQTNLSIGQKKGPASS